MVVSLPIQNLLPDALMDERWIGEAEWIAIRPKLLMVLLDFRGRTAALDTTGSRAVPTLRSFILVEDDN